MFSFYFFEKKPDGYFLYFIIYCHYIDKPFVFIKLHQVYLTLTLIINYLFILDNAHK